MLSDYFKSYPQFEGQRHIEMDEYPFVECSKSHICMPLLDNCEREIKFIAETYPEFMDAQDMPYCLEWMEIVKPTYTELLNIYLMHFGRRLNCLS